jgi:hypothetical protein
MATTTITKPSLPLPFLSDLSFKRNPTDYFIWTLDMCIIAGGCSAMLVDFVPENGTLQSLTLIECDTLAKSLEKTINKRTMRPFGKRPTVSRMLCGFHNTPETFYQEVVRAVRLVAAMRSVSENETDESIPHVFIMQDLERAPPRVLACLDELITTQLLTAPTSSNSFAGLSETIRLPSPFVILGTTSKLPRSSATTSLYGGNLDPPALPERLLNAFLLRIPILLPVVTTSITPSSVVAGNTTNGIPNNNNNNNNMSAPSTPSSLIPQPPPPPPPPSASIEQRESVVDHTSSNSGHPNNNNNIMSEHHSSQQHRQQQQQQQIQHPQQQIFSTNRRQLNPSNVYCSSKLTFFMRDVITALRSHPLVCSGPGPLVSEIWILAAKTCAALRGSRYVVPQDLFATVIEVLAHRIVVVDIGQQQQRSSIPNSEGGEIILPPPHPVVLARTIVAQVYGRMPALR